MTVVRADARYRSSQDGIESWHCFAAGAHYDPSNVSFGPIIGVDEHLVAVGAGFDWHGHRGVDIVSCVLAGALRHELLGESARVVRAGEVLVQSAGSGIRHRETNASDTEPLRFVQTTVLSMDGARFDVWREGSSTSAKQWHVFVGDGAWRLGPDLLEAGDSVRGSGGLAMEGGGRLLVWRHGNS